MKVRNIMKMRTTVERNTRTSDTGGGYTDSWNEVVSDLPCYCWYEQSSGEMAGTDGLVQVIDNRMLMVPWGTDVTEQDRLSQVTDRSGSLLFDGPLMVDAVGEMPGYLMLTTRKVA